MTDPMTNIDDQLKNFDFTTLRSIGYDRIQEIADQYLQSTDPERQELGQSLKEIDKNVFELTPAEQSAKRINDYLASTGKSEDDVARFSNQILVAANEQAVAKIVGAMSEDTYQEWLKLSDYDPNILQRLYLLNEASNMLLKKSYDDVYEEELQKAVDIAISILTSTLEKANLASKLTIEQANSVMVAFNANQYEVAIQLIYKFVNENES